MRARKKRVVKRSRQKLSRLEDHDPFEVIGSIPKGKSYQWVPQAPSGEGPDIYGLMRDAGWKRVPANRHPKMKAANGRIAYGGQVLMERPAKVTVAAQKRDREKAAELFKHTYVPQKGFRSSSLVHHIDTTRDATSYEKMEADSKLELDRTNNRFPVPMTLEASERDIQAAATCGLLVSEYMRRKFLMLSDILGTPIIIMRKNANGSYSIVDGLKVTEN